MKVHSSVAKVLQNLELPSAVTAYLENNKADGEDDFSVNGGILQDAKHVWLSNGSKFTVLNIESGQKIAAWTFGAALRDFKARVTCVCELSPPLIENTIQLLIGLECDLIGGMVCLFHCNGSKILRAIQIDCQVICIQYIDSFPGSPLNCFDGGVLVGTHGGATLILDLNRQTCAETILNPDRFNDTIVKDELNVANLMVLSIDNIDVVVEQRAIACGKDHHIAIQVNEGCIHNLQFILHNPDNSINRQVERENVYVTSILYVPEITSVVIGLNIGAFQLWNLCTLQLEYTSPTTMSDLPITHIAFLEPCDDPRAFCYIWIVHSVLDRHEDGFPVAAMYSLTYQEKRNINDLHFIYQNFISCNLRFNIELSHIDSANNFSRNFTGGRCISCQSLVKSPNKEDTDEYVLNICQIVWECWTLSTISPVHSIMVLFDIDQWYKEHMPECSAMQTNNYMSVVSLSDTLSHPVSTYLCDVKINADTLTSYFSVQRLEEHFFPNALGYECFCLTNNNITKVLTMGIQRQLLASINDVGPSILLHPTKIFQQCINSGLIPMYIEPYPNLETPEHMQRQVLLSIVLEARLVQFLSKCACDWATGSHTSVGCTLQLLLEWSWNRALGLKHNGDRITIPFFNHSGITPDRNTILQLDSCVRQLGHIGSLYNSVIEKCSAAMLPGVIEEVQERQKIIQIVAQYFQVIQWFLNVGLLPEFHVDQFTDNMNNCLPYPIESLTEFYQNRRLKLHCLNGENPANESLENKSCKLLFIDEFIRIECCQNKLKGLWIEDKSSINGLYPPPSLHSLLKMYLIPEIKEEHKHSLILYTLIDYAMMFDNERYESVIRRLMQFPTMFGLSNTAIKVTQAFWHLDHRDFQLALNQLQCVLAGGCLSQWQHNVVLSSLLIQKKTQSALQYLHVRKPYSSSEMVSKLYDDWEACSNLYLSRGLVYEAFNLNKDATKYLSTDDREERLKIFFNGCKKMGLLSKVLSLPLTKHEENVFIKFLKSTEDSHASDILVMYYLNRSRYIEAQKANEELKRITVKSQLPYDVTNDFSMKKEHVYKTETRDQLVDLYCKTLPPITRQLANYTNSSRSNRKVNYPVPLTVSVQAKTPKPTLYKSTLLQETIDKASETWMNKSCVVRSLKRLHQVEETPFLCTPKLTKSIQMFAEKMNITPEETPTKKSKLNTSENYQATPIKTGNISIKLTNEINTILRTPVIERKSKWNPGSVSSQYSTEALSLRRESTPQSILKNRKLREYCNSSPVYQRYLAETDDELETNSQYTQSDNLSRSIRFKIPTENNTPSPLSEYLSDMHDSFSDLCNYEPVKSDYSSKHFSPTNISPRKSIHHSCNDNVHFKENLSQESNRSFSPTPDEMKNMFSDSNLSVTPVKSTLKEFSQFNDTLSKSIKSNITHTSIELNAINRNRISQIINASNTKNMSVISNTSVLASDTSEELISDVSFATVVDEPKFVTSESNDSMIALKSTESCKSFESSIFSQNENDVNFIDKKSNTLSNFTSDHQKNISMMESKASSLVFDRKFIDDEKIHAEIDSDHPCNINLSTGETVNSILNVVFNPSIAGGSENPVEEKNISSPSNNNLEIATHKAEKLKDNDSSNPLKYDENNEQDDESVLLQDLSKSETLIEKTLDNQMINDERESNNIGLLQTLPTKLEFQLEKNKDLNTSINIYKENSQPDILLKFTSESEQETNFILNKSTCENFNMVQSTLKQSDNNVNSITNSYVENPDTPTKSLDMSKSTSVILSEINSTIGSNVEIFAISEKSMKIPESTSILVSEINSSIINSIETPSTLEKSMKLSETASVSVSEMNSSAGSSIEAPAVSEISLKISESASVSTSEMNSPISSCVEVATVSDKSIKISETASTSEVNSTISSSNDITLTPLKTSKILTRTRKTPRKSIDSDSDSVLSNQSSRRSLRSSSKLNTSLTSQSSVDSDQESTPSLRKPRKSILSSVKPNLSVIPEMSIDDKSVLNKTRSSLKDATQSSIDIALYSSSRRLTRHQKTLLEKSYPSISFEHSKIVDSKVNMSTIEDVEYESDSVDSNVTSETLDPILLLDKNDYKGPPDPEERAMLNEVYAFSRESSVLSNRLEIDSGSRTKENSPDSVRSKRSRSIRLLPDIQESPTKTNSSTTHILQDESVTDSPSKRLRRQSFNRAVEALSTPRKSRRLSTDSKKSELDLTINEVETPSKDIIQKVIENSKITTDVEIANPSTSKNLKISTPSLSMRPKRTKAASIHGDSSVSNIEAATPLRKIKPRKSIFNTPVTTKDRMSVVEESTFKQKIKRRPTHKVMPSLKFVKK